MPALAYRIGDFVFDGERGLLMKHGSPIPLSQRALHLLAALLAANGKPVSKDALMDAAWPNETVEESNLTVQIAALRKCLGRTTAGDDWISTVQRFGYQFVNPDKSQAAYALKPLQTASPTLVVLPFANLGQDKEQDYLIDGLAEDLITDLSKIKGLTVIARHSSFSFRSSGVSESEIAERLGARYIVTGSVRRSSGLVRINAQLTDAEKSATLWAERYDRDLTDMFGAQDDVVLQVAKAVRGNLEPNDVSGRYHSPSIEAYDLVLRSRQWYIESRQSNRNAHDNFVQAIALDPAYPEPYWRLAVIQLLWWVVWGDDQMEAKESCMAYARKALELAPEDPDVLETMGFVLMKHNRSEESFYYRTKALELAPNHPRSHLGFSDLYFNWGEAEKAKHAITRAIHLDPYPPDVYFHHLGRAQLQLGEVDDAIATLERTEANPVMAGFLLAAALAKAGRKAEAKAMTRKFCQALPHWTISRWIENEFLRHDKDVKFWQATFRLAGLPE